jgi:hypothetical protein
VFALLLFVAVVILMAAAGLSAAKIFEKTRSDTYRRTREQGTKNRPGRRLRFGS